MTVCKEFMEDDNCYTHKCELDEKKYQLVFYNMGDESCGIIATEDEIAEIMAVDTVMVGSMQFIGSDADAWSDEEFRTRVCDKAIAIYNKNNVQ